MSTLFDNTALLHDHDIVRRLDCRKPMGNNDRGTASGGLIKCCLHDPFGFGIQSGRSLIQE